MRFLHVRLEAPAPRLSALADFYGRALGIELATDTADRFSFAAGETAIEFAAGAGQPFYHFALLAPGNRFAAALEWAAARTQLLPDPESGEIVFDFENWQACACYFHDPAGNIVELIAHRGVDETRSSGAFQPSELAGVSELGIVGDPRAMAARLAEELALEVWDGTLEERDRLAFVGEKARTLILSPPGRGWLPTRRAAEPHAVDVLLAAPRAGEVELEGSRYRITSGDDPGRHGRAPSA
jgi:catechol 2,3-dioxygenase-like lactoylglutathione lyase family enzyme